jgi:hypothetical protein
MDFSPWSESPFTGFFYGAWADQFTPLAGNGRKKVRWGEDDHLPDRFPSYATCFLRFSRWVKEGTLRRGLEALALDLQARGEIDLSECIIDAPSWWRKKGAQSGKDQARKRYEAHGHCGGYRSSTRRAHSFC